MLFTSPKVLFCPFSVAVFDYETDACFAAADVCAEIFVGMSKVIQIERSIGNNVINDEPVTGRQPGALRFNDFKSVISEATYAANATRRPRQHHRVAGT